MQEHFSACALIYSKALGAASMRPYGLKTAKQSNGIPGSMERGPGCGFYFFAMNTAKFAAAWLRTLFFRKGVQPNTTPTGPKAFLDHRQKLK